jgi:CBS domain-containing protein
MKASDIMTSPVISVGLDTPVQEIAALLLEKRISAVPVLDEGRLAGVVSEGDLLHRWEIGTDARARAQSWWLRLFASDPSPADYVRSHARRARDVMTRTVVSIGPDMGLPEIAALLESRRIKRVPVMRGSELVGIVSRANLVQALAVVPLEGMRLTPPADETIRARLLAELELQPWWHSMASNVIVAGGIVHYLGVVESEDERDAARVAAENIPGVRRVEDGRPLFHYMASMM